MTLQPAEAPLNLEWSLGDRLRKIRRATGFSQSDFAQKLGQNQKTYASWELDTTAPRNLVAIAKRIEALTGAPAAWVLGIEYPAAPGVGTEVSTSRYFTPSVPERAPLWLVPPLDSQYRDESDRYGSCPSTSGYAGDRPTLQWAGTVNHADSA